MWTITLVQIASCVFESFGREFGVNFAIHASKII